jgi:hypothetical protein
LLETPLATILLFLISRYLVPALIGGQSVNKLFEKSYSLKLEFKILSNVISESPRDWFVDVNLPNDAPEYDVAHLINLLLSKLMSVL